MLSEEWDILKIRVSEIREKWICVSRELGVIVEDFRDEKGNKQLYQLLNALWPYALYENIEATLVVIKEKRGRLKRQAMIEENHPLSFSHLLHSWSQILQFFSNFMRW